MQNATILNYDPDTPFRVLKLIILDRLVLHWNKYDNGWYYVSTNGDENPVKDIVMSIRKRFSENEFTDGVEYTNILVNNKYEKIKVLDIHEHPLTEQKKWDQFGGPLHTLDKNKMYELVYGGKERFIQIDSYEYSDYTKHYKWKRPKTISF
jgi:hypothetical protein